MSAKFTFMSDTPELPSLRDVLARLLHDTSNVLGELILQLDTEGASTTSRKSTFERQNLGNWKWNDADQGSPIADALTNILMNIDSANNHMHRFVASLVTTAEVSYALATLTRASLEGLGRALWLLQSATTDELVGRYELLVMGELESALRINPDGVLRYRGTTEELKVSEAIENVAKDLERNGYTKGSRGWTPRSVSQTEMVSSVLAGFPGSSKQFYSHLSAVAHGQAGGLSYFVTGIDLEQMRLYIEALNGASQLVAHEMCDFFGASKTLATNVRSRFEANHFHLLDAQTRILIGLI